MDGYTSVLYFQHLFTFAWSDVLLIDYSIGIDGLSLFFVLLTTFLTPICVLVSWNSIKYRVKDFLFFLLLIEFIIVNVFITSDLFFFFVFFESVLIPMFFMIGIWGSRQRKIHAVYQFFIYTLFGSVFLFLGILIIYYELGTTDYMSLAHHP